MRNFRRALVSSCHHWPWLALSFLCSAAVAGLWSTNIAALFPILEVTLRGKSLHAWNAERMEISQQAITALSQQIEQAELALASPAATDAMLRPTQLAEWDLQRQAEQARLAAAEHLQPWIEAYLPVDPLQTVVSIVVFLVICSLLKQLLQIAGTMCVALVSNRISRSLRHQVFDKALGMDRAGYLAVGQSGFTTQITMTSDMLAGGIQNVYGGMVSEPLKIAACLMGAAFISWRLLLASMLFAPVSAVLVLVLNRRLKIVALRLIDRSLGMHHVLLEALQSLITVQAYTMEHEERKRFHRSTADMMNFSLKAQFYSALTNPITEILCVSMIGLSLILGARIALAQEFTLFGIAICDRPLSISAMMVFFGMLVGAADPLRRLSGVLAGINSGMVAANALYPLLDRPSLIHEPAQPRTVPRPHRALTFENVSFGYRPDHLVLRNVNFTVPFGERVVVVGPNGGGKSTLVSLLCRFYDPAQGRILLDGVPLHEMAVRDLRGRMALVTQHTELFNESILYNIRYGRWEATDEEVIAAAKLARAHDFIAAIPEQYQARVGPSGFRLSGGQRQRIALARALLRNPEILILDEATSQIDRDSERLIHEVLQNFGRSRTIIVISHRESALNLADTVMHIDHGTLEIVNAAKAAA